MIDRLPHVLLSPEFDDEEDTRTARTLHRILLATLAVQVIAIPFPLYPGPLTYRLGVTGCLVAVAFVGLALIARRRLLAASYVTVTGFWLLLTVVNAIGAGLRAVSFSAYVICVVLAVWLIGPPAGLVVGAMSAGAGLAMLAAERAGWVRFVAEQANPAQLWVIHSLILAFTVAFLTFAVQSVRRALCRARREAAVRAHTDLRLEQSEARFRQVVDAVPLSTHLAAAVEQAGDLVVILDAAGGIRYVNPAFERLTGHPRDAIAGHAPGASHGSAAEPAFASGLRAILRRGAAWSGRLVDRARDGTTVTVEASASPIRSDAGDLLGYVAVMRDISERLALEERLRQSQKMESVGRLAGGVAHDFNNLLSPILGYSDMLLAELHPDDPRTRRIDAIREAAERASVLTRQLLSLSRGQVLEIRTVDLNRVVEDFSKILRRTIRDSILIDLRLASDAAMVDADTSQMEQILMNLVLNARDAMPAGGRITIETALVTLGPDGLRDEPELRDGPYVALRVTDTGSGMPPEVAAHVFEPFFTTKEKDRGTGLGLATVYGIVRQHNGAVSVRSEPGKGSTFTIHLPAAVAAAPTGF